MNYLPLDSNKSDGEKINVFYTDPSPSHNQFVRGSGKRCREQRYQCQYCEHRACTKSDLVKHERVHTGERPYMCHICGVGYLQSSHLHDHTRLHAGLKPFSCDVCLRGFSKKSDMVRHRRIHTGELPYVCNVCGKAFRQTTQCSNHVKKHHPNPPKSESNTLQEVKPNQTDVDEVQVDVDGFNADFFLSIIAHEHPDLLDVSDSDFLFDVEESNLLSNSLSFLC